MEAAEYWILEAVIDGMYLLSALREDLVEEAFNRRGHGLNRIQLVDTLDAMFSRGEIIAEREVDRQMGTGEQFTPTRNEIAELLAKPQRVRYGMTDFGAVLWEEISQPDWNRYAYGELSLWDYVSMTESCNERLLHEYLSRGDLKRWIVSEVSWKTLQNYQATYWKLLPIGYQINFQVKQGNEGRGFPIAQPEPDWYTNPFIATVQQ